MGFCFANVLLFAYPNAGHAGLPKDQESCIWGCGVLHYIVLAHKFLEEACRGESLSREAEKFVHWKQWSCSRATKMISAHPLAAQLKKLLP